MMSERARSSAAPLARPSLPFAPSASVQHLMRPLVLAKSLSRGAAQLAVPAPAHSSSLIALQIFLSLIILSYNDALLGYNDFGFNLRFLNSDTFLPLIAYVALVYTSFILSHLSFARPHSL